MNSNRVLLLLVLLSQMWGCRGLTAPGTSDRQVPAPEVVSTIRVVDADGTPLAGGTLLVDNRQYEENPEKWILFSIDLDGDGQFVLGWPRGTVTDFELGQQPNPGPNPRPSFRFLSVVADTSFVELVYPLTYRSFGVRLPAGLELNRGIMTAIRSRPRLGDAPPYNDRFKLELDSTLTMSGWLDGSVYNSRAVFYGPGEERLEFGFAEPVRPDSALVALGFSRIHLRPVELVWPDSLPVEPEFRFRSSVFDAPDPLDQYSWARDFDRSNYAGGIPVPDGNARVSVSVFDGLGLLGELTQVDRGPEYDGASVLFLGDHWLRVAVGSGWEPGESFEVSLSSGADSGRVTFRNAKDAMILASRTDYVLSIRRDSDDTQLLLRILELDQNYDFFFDAPGILRLR